MESSRDQLVQTNEFFSFIPYTSGEFRRLWCVYEINFFFLRMRFERLQNTDDEFYYDLSFEFERGPTDVAESKYRPLAEMGDRRAADNNYWIYVKRIRYI